MKRRIFIFLLAALCGFPIFANTEMDVLTSCDLVWIKFEDGTERSAYLKAPSADMSIDFLFLPLGKAAAMGLGIGGGFGVHSWIGTSVVLRHTFNDTNSLSFSVGAKMNYMNIASSDFNCNALSFGLSHKHWLLNADGFHFGIMVGSSIDVLFNGKREYTSYYAYTDGYGYADWDEKEVTYDLERGLISRFFVGICMNLGDRVFDKHR